METIQENLANISKETNTSYTDTCEAAAEFSRQGLSSVEVLKRTKDAMILSRLSGLDALNSVKELESVIKTFKNT